jgi:hypothetical protein
MVEVVDRLYPFAGFVRLLPAALMFALKLENGEFCPL